VGDHLERLVRRAAVFGDQHAFGLINHWTSLERGTKALNLVLALVEILVRFGILRKYRNHGRPPAGSGPNVGHSRR
jgi:hypothetical protein